MAALSELQILASLTEPECSAETAVQQLLQHTYVAASSTTSSVSDALFTHLNNTWHSLMQDVVATTVPSRQTRLVEFVRLLQKQNVTDPATGDQLRFDQDYNKAVWTEVPNFGINVADDWNFGKFLASAIMLSCMATNFAIIDPTASSPDPKEESQYYNKIAFLAQLSSSPANFTQNPEQQQGPFDFSLYALRAFRAAFENSSEPHAPNNILLRAASLWTIYAADRLWANVQMNRDFRHKSSNSNPAREGDYYSLQKKSWSGFNKERWGIWVQGLKNGMKIEDDDVRQLVEKALKEVERVEDQSWRVMTEERFA